ncbi:hypothetical protein R3P38DRAFT_246627 [Favolaschia claudopus]|uniref:Uncharacterized protein n=1 Tax=Favolaschia claudopus TaxID=2862362 RepID=A0AAW0D037_9AGAR
MTTGNLPGTTYRQSGSAHEARWGLCIEVCRRTPIIPCAICHRERMREGSDEVRRWNKAQAAKASKAAAKSPSYLSLPSPLSVLLICPRAGGPSEPCMWRAWTAGRSQLKPPWGLGSPSSDHLGIELVGVVDSTEKVCFWVSSDEKKLTQERFGRRICVNVFAFTVLCSTCPMGSGSGSSSGGGAGVRIGVRRREESNSCTKNTNEMIFFCRYIVIPYNYRL